VRQFTRLIIRGEDADQVRDEAKHIAQRCTDTIKAEHLDVRLLGPAPAPVSKIKSQYPFHVMLAGPHGDTGRNDWRELAPQLSTREDVEWTVDVDPINLR